MKRENTRIVKFVVGVGILVVLYLSESAGLVVAQKTSEPRSRCVSTTALAKDVLLLSESYEEAQAAGLRLRNLSTQSPRCRQRVIAAVMEAMDIPNLDVSRNQARNNLWREGAVLLGDLKAAQALDLLLSHITMTDGEWSITMIHQPALEGIIRMGTIAVPKLSALLEHDDPKVRQTSVYCIAWIGGHLARRSLQKVLQKESDPCVKRFISVSIDTINVKSGGLNTDDGEWLTAFLCRN